MARSYADETIADLYDIAFGFRREREADFAEACLESFGQRADGGVLDLACGGGHFLRDMQDRGWRVAGVDISPHMIRFARGRLGWRPVLQATCMSDFRMSGRFDLATCWYDSLTYLHTNEALIRHLRCVSQVLKAGGLYLLDLGFGRWSDPMWNQTLEDWAPDFTNGWSASRDGVEVYHDGCDGPPCDGLSHLYTEYLYFRATDLPSGRVHEYRSTARKRALHPQEFAALVSASAAFELVAWFTGNMDMSQTLEMADGRGRGLPVLRRVPMPCAP